MNTIEIENQLGITFCDRQNIALDYGEGSYVWDENGKKYVDFTSGWGVTCLGHSHPIITQAITEQAKKLLQNPNSGFTYSPVRSRLLQSLARVLPNNLQQTYFVNSGAEANDAAIKLARKITGRKKVIATTEAFHGRTFNTLSVSGGTENVNKYLPVLKHNQFAEFGNINAIKKLIDSQTAAVIIEPIQGEGGVRIPPAEYLQQVSQLCLSVGALLIIDEVQTGFCRTGHFFAIDKYRVQVDILTMGKGIAGGFPFAAFAVSGDVADKISKGDHGGTYCGNPLACAVSLAVVDYLSQHNVAEQAAKSGQLLLNGLQKLARQYPDIIHSVRGQGLLTAVEFCNHDLVKIVCQRCSDYGLLVTPTRDGVIRLIPDLLISREDISLGLEIFSAQLKAL